MHVLLLSVFGSMTGGVGIEEGVTIDCGIVADEFIRTFGGETEMMVVCEWLQSRCELPKTLVHELQAEDNYSIPNCIANFIQHLFNLLKPTGYVMHHQFNIQQLYALPTLYLCVFYLSENKQRLVPLTA